MVTHSTGREDAIEKQYALHLWQIRQQHPCCQIETYCLWLFSIFNGNDNAVSPTGLAVFYISPLNTSHIIMRHM